MGSRQSRCTCRDLSVEPGLRRAKRSRYDPDGIRILLSECDRRACSPIIRRQQARGGPPITAELFFWSFTAKVRGHFLREQLHTFKDLVRWHSRQWHRHHQMSAARASLIVFDHLDRFVRCSDNQRLAKKLRGRCLAQLPDRWKVRTI